MRVFYDLCVSPRSRGEAAEMARLLRLLRVRGVAVERGVGVEEFRRAGLEAYTRVTIRAGSGSEVAVKVREARRLYDIVAVKPSTAEAARMAARDPRVDLVVLPPAMARYMDKSQARLLELGGGCIEVWLSHLLSGGDPRRTLRGILIIARRAAANDACLVVSSNAKTRWGLWSPYSAMALLECMGLPHTAALSALTVNPAMVVRMRGLQ